MRTLNVTQGSPEWRAARNANYRTASVANAMMGVCKCIKRNELLHMIATGSEQEFSDWVRKNILQRGHEYEAAARPIAERIVGEELSAVTVTDDDGYLLASLDGMTMADDVTWEHKQPSTETLAIVRAGKCPEYHYWQVVQGLAIPKADRCLFMVSDGTEETEAHVWVERNDDDIARLIAGWRQFDEDLAAYVPPEVIPAAVAAPVKDLPVVIYKRDGLALTSNLPAVRSVALSLIEDSKKAMETDQDFADRIELCKRFGEYEKRIEVIKAQVLGELTDINTFCGELSEIAALMRQARLAGDKLVEAEKSNRKNKILSGGKDRWSAHLAACNTRLGKAYMPLVAIDFAAAIKGMSNMDNMQNAVDTLLANKKIEANAIADLIDSNRKMLVPQDGVAGEDWISLFPDFAHVCTKPADDFHNLVTARVAAHKAAKEKALEAERVKIRAEEEAKAQAKAKADQEAEDAAVAGIWRNARRIEFNSDGPVVGYIEKAIVGFESMVPDWESDPRPRVAAAVAEARKEMQEKLAAAKAKAEQAAMAMLTIEQNIPPAQPASTPANAGIEATPATGNRETSPVTNVAQIETMHITPVDASALRYVDPAQSLPPIDNGARLNLGQLCGALGFTVTAEFLGRIGFPPVATDKQAKLYRAADFPLICRAIALHLAGAAAEFMQKSA